MVQTTNSTGKWIKAMIGLVLIGLLVMMADVSELWGALSQLSLISVVYLGGIAVVLIYVSALKWKLFLSALGAEESVSRLFRLYLVGYFINLILPSYVGGDAVRSWYVGKRFGQHEALAATILERYTGLLAMVSLALMVVWFPQGISFEIKVVVVIVALGLLAGTIFALSPYVGTLLGKHTLTSALTRHVEKIQAGFSVLRGDPRLLFKTMALSFLFHSVTVINTIIAAHAVGWHTAAPLDLFVVLPLILLIGALPLSPQGLGIQEGAFYFFLHAVGASPAQALGVALVLRAKSYVLAIIGGAIWLGMRAERKVEV